MRFGSQRSKLEAVPAFRLGDESGAAFGMQPLDVALCVYKNEKPSTGRSINAADCLCCRVD